MLKRYLDFLLVNEGKFSVAELDFQIFSTVQSSAMFKPQTIASANTIAPVSFLTIMTGNVLLKTITPPLLSLHMLAIQFAGAAGNDATGNILTTKASIAGMVLLYIFNPSTQKYVPVGDNV
jgi:hypothetical protein